jgi:hypothetical protein
MPRRSKSERIVLRIASSEARCDAAKSSALFLNKSNLVIRKENLSIRLVTLERNSPKLSPAFIRSRVNSSTLLPDFSKPFTKPSPTASCASSKATFMRSILVPKSS